MNDVSHHPHRVTPAAALYVLTVAGSAAAGFVTGTSWPILLAAVLALPASVITLPAYYLVYGFLALVPGANPSSSSGSGSVAADGSIVTTDTGGQALWFRVATVLVGVALLTIGAAANVVAVRALRSRSRAAADAPPRSHQGG